MSTLGYEPPTRHEMSRAPHFTHFHSALLPLKVLRISRRVCLARQRSHLPRESTQRISLTSILPPKPPILCSAAYRLGPGFRRGNRRAAARGLLGYGLEVVGCRLLGYFRQSLSDHIHYLLPSSKHPRFYFKLLEHFRGARKLG